MKEMSIDTEVNDMWFLVECETPDDIGKKEKQRWELKHETFRGTIPLFDLKVMGIKHESFGQIVLSENKLKHATPEPQNYLITPAPNHWPKPKGGFKR